MPFIEIGRKVDWVSIKSKSLTICKSIRDSFFMLAEPVENNIYYNVRIFYDEEENLLGLKPDEEGYKINRKGEVRCSILPREISVGTYECKYDKEKKMVIVDLNKTI